MNKADLQKVVLEKLAETDEGKPEVSGETQEAETEVKEEIKDEKPESTTETEEEVKPEKKSGLQKRLDKLTRDKHELLERAELAEKKLADEKKVKESSTDSDEELPLDEPSKKYLERVVKGLLDSQLKERENLDNQNRVANEKQEFNKQFEGKLLEAFSGEFDEDTGYFSETAISKMNKLHEQFETNPKFWLDAMENYGVDKTYTLATLGEISPKVEKKKDSVDKILEKERLAKSVTPSSSNVTERVQRREGENKRSYLGRIVANAMDKA